MTAFYTITNGTTVPADGYFSIPGNFTAMFTGGFEFVAVDSGTGSPMVSSSTTFTVSSSAYVSGQTQITPVAGPSLTPAGQWITMVGGAYTINFSDPAGSPNALTVPVATVNSDTDLNFPGRASFNYGEILNENLLHLLENFASPTAPTQPIEGQLWYEKGVGLKVWDGSSWASTASGISGVDYDDITITGSPTSPIVPTVNVSTTAAAAGKAYQQVFRNGSLEREGVTYNVSGVNEITFTITLNGGDNIMIYKL